MELMQKTIGACLQEQAEKNPKKMALVADEQSYTWKELDCLSNYMAARMLAYGVKTGTHAGIWSTNSPNWIITFLALEKLGAIPVLLNTCYSQDELEQVISYGDVEYVYYGEGYKKQIYEEIVSVLKEKPGCRVKRWIYIGRDYRRQWMTKESFVHAEQMKKAVMQVNMMAKQVQPENTAAMLFTSGTTARPKGVLLSHCSLVNNALDTCRHMKWGQEDKMLIAVPLFHCFGITSSLLSSIHTGFAMYVIEYFKTQKVLEMVHNQKCTLLNGVPSMFLAVVRNPERRRFDLSSLKSGIIAGSPIMAEEYMQIRRNIPNLMLHSSYGQTETSPCVSISDVGDGDEVNATASGRILENCEIRILSIETSENLRKEIPPQRVEHKVPLISGEICVKGYNVMQGYYHLPEETAKAIDGDGLLHTGDLGWVDEKGYVHVTGRIKELIIRGGENISPREIEEVICCYPGICEARVIGLPTEVLQEMVVACVIPESGRQISESGLRAFLEKRIAYYKVPSYVIFMKTFPVTASGKVELGRLKELASQYVRSLKYQEILRS